MSDTERVQCILKDLQVLCPEVDITKEYAGGTDPCSQDYVKDIFVMDWTSKWTMGAAGVHFLGQFNKIYPILAQNHGSIYFAGDHLSINPLFIAGALDSAKFTVQQLVQREFDKDTVIEFLYCLDSKVGKSRKSPKKAALCHLPRV